MAEELHKNFGVEAELVPGDKGIFNVMVDGDLVFSKFETGRFPNDGEVSAKIKK